MSAQLDLDDVASQSELAVKELVELRDRVKELEDALSMLLNEGSKTPWKDRLFALCILKKKEASCDR